MKRGNSPFKLIGEIILVLIVVVIIITAISPLYRETFVNGIKKIFGEDLESEILHEKNIQAEEAFNIVKENVEKCKSSLRNKCGCSFNTNNFNENHMILSTNSEIRLVNIGKIERKELLKDLNQGNLIKNIDIKNTNCFFNKRLKKETLSLGKIFFDGAPYLYEKRGWIFQKDKRYLNIDYPLYKNLNGDICWTSKEVQNVKSC